ncbi:gamma-tubulin complex, component 3 [Pelomyxa schiedti]|nr:gamma-tubulin complex, component 3 [Pelomyxa schiedti]
MTSTTSGVNGAQLVETLIRLSLSQKGGTLGNEVVMRLVGQALLLIGPPCAQPQSSFGQKRTLTGGNNSSSNSPAGLVRHATALICKELMWSGQEKLATDITRVSNKLADNESLPPHTHSVLLMLRYIANNKNSVTPRLKIARTAPKATQNPLPQTDNSVQRSTSTPYTMPPVPAVSVRIASSPVDCSIFQPGLSPPQIHLANFLLESGWLFTKIKAYADAEQSDTGLVAQAFSGALQSEIKEYYRFLAVLDSQRNQEEAVTLLRVNVWCHQPQHRLLWLACMVDAVKGLKGGALASAVYSFSKHGDVLISRLVNQMLSQVAKPLFMMIRLWVFEGRLLDSEKANSNSDEFFIVADPNAKDEESIWHNKYHLSEDMLPSFISVETASKILLVGKSINFLRYCCHDVNVVNELTLTSAQRTLDFEHLETLPATIDRIKIFAAGTGKALFPICLILKKGDFIQYLTDLVGKDLSQPLCGIFKHNLASSLELAIRGSNAQFDDPDILARLDISLPPPTSTTANALQQTGWDAFSLDYHVDSPINTIFTTEVMQTYLKLFKLLWKIKCVEHSLSGAWHTHTSCAHLLRNSKELMQQLHGVRLLLNEMMHFIYNLQYYIMFEVLECSWATLVSDMKKATNFDEVIDAHKAYLQSIVEKSLMNYEQPQWHLQRLFQEITTLCLSQESLYASARSQQLHQEGMDTEATELIIQDPKAVFQCSAQYKQLLSKLMTCLKQHSTDPNIQFLLFRLDFNEYYARQQRCEMHPVGDSFMADTDTDSEQLQQQLASIRRSVVTKPTPAAPKRT